MLNKQIFTVLLILLTDNLIERSAVANFGIAWLKIKSALSLALLLTYPDPAKPNLIGYGYRTSHNTGLLNVATAPIKIKCECWMMLQGYSENLGSQAYKCYTIVINDWRVISDYKIVVKLLKRAIVIRLSTVWLLSYVNCNHIRFIGKISSWILF